jgi:uncharacterized membrane protein YhaH (DUF805 family)
MEQIGIIRWIDPRRPIGRLAFAVSQFVLVSFAQLFLRRITSFEPRQFSTVPVFPIAIGAIIIFGVMCTLIIKRLQDVGWSTLWALLICGPILTYSLFLIDRLIRPMPQTLVFFAGLLLLAFCGLLLLLIVLPGTSPPTPTTQPTTWSLRSCPTISSPPSSTILKTGCGP